MQQAVQTSRLILASASPRRRQLLAEAGFDFDVVEPPVGEPEDLPAGLTPTRRAEALAYFKARLVAERGAGGCVLGADTIVSLGGQVLGKAADCGEAGRMLSRLSGTRHAVITGVALVDQAVGRLIASETTYVTMRPMSDREIADYVHSGEWAGKAGAYAIQETADRFVAKLEGSFSNVVGLPIELVRRMLDELYRSAPGRSPRWT